MEGIIISEAQLACGDPVSVAFFRAVVFLAVEEGQKADGMPLQGADAGAGDVGLADAVADGLAEETGALRGAHAFERGAVQPSAANA